MRASSPAVFGGLLPVLVLLTVLASCAEPEPPPEVPVAVDPFAAPAPRVVSLSPAITRTLVDLELAGCLVGRSRFCDFLEDDVPVVGDLNDVDLERLIVIDPTHVLVQPPGAGVDTALRDACAEFGWALHSWPGLDRLDDIRALVRELPVVLAPKGSTARTQLAARAETLCARLDAALVPEPGAWTGPTLLAYGTDPVSVYGRETFLIDMLEALGARNAVTTAAWTTLSLEDVARLDPAAIIMVRPSADAGVDPISAAGPLATLDVRAVRDGRIAVLAHDDALRPGTGVIDAAGAMRRVLHGLGAKRDP